MRRIILFSEPQSDVIQKITPILFPANILNKKVAFMPSDGADKNNGKYLPFWEDLSAKNKAEFTVINNALPKEASENEKKKILNSNILIISGGNTFRLLGNLKKNGMDDTIKRFSKKDNTVLSGFSAGALVLTPKIDICNTPGYDTNNDNLTDLTGLDIVPYEIFPHYDKTREYDATRYEDEHKTKVRRIKNNEFITINKD